MKTTYQIDPAHSSAQFVIRHMMITNVRGGFTGVKGTVTWDPEHPADARIEAEIAADSLKTNDEQRDAHVKGPDFLDTAVFPAITFKSGKIAPQGEGELSVTGELTIHGVTREIGLRVEGITGEAKDLWGNSRIGASASTKIKRSDFGLLFNAPLETGGVLLGDELKLEIEVSLVKVS